MTSELQVDGIIGFASFARTKASELSSIRSEADLSEIDSLRINFAATRILKSVQNALDYDVSFEERDELLDAELALKTLRGDPVEINDEQ